MAVTVAVVVTLGLAMAVLPGAPGPITVPAKHLWQFCVASLSGSLLLWGVITLGVGILASPRHDADTGGGADAVSAQSL